MNSGFIKVVKDGESVNDKSRCGERVTEGVVLKE